MGGEGELSRVWGGRGWGGFWRRRSFTAVWSTVARASSPETAHSIVAQEVRCCSFIELMVSCTTDNVLARFERRDRSSETSSSISATLGPVQFMNVYRSLMNHDSGFDSGSDSWLLAGKDGGGGEERDLGEGAPQMQPLRFTSSGLVPIATSPSPSLEA